MTNRPKKKRIHVKQCGCGMWDAETGEPVILTNSVSEMLEFYITAYKEDGFLPNNFRLSDNARNYLKGEMRNVLKSGRKFSDEDAVMEILANMIFGFCMGYYINEIG
jgi:hypothetical protein